MAAEGIRRGKKVCETKAQGFSSRLAALLCARSKLAFGMRKQRFDN